jgi:hypothetical protein
MMTSANGGASFRKHSRSRFPAMAKEFYCDETPKLGISREQNGAHPASPESPNDFVMPDIFFGVRIGWNLRRRNDWRD